MASRREFIKSLAIGSGVIVAGSLLIPTKNAFAQAPNKKFTKKDLVSPKDDNAKALNYCENAEKDTKACPGHKDASKKGQKCGSPCNFFTPAGTVAGITCGKCLVIPGDKYVLSTGWCNSWAAKT